MYWKLRIPLFLFVLGTVSGLAQKYPINTSYFFRSTLHIGLIISIVTAFEKTKLNEKKVHFTIGIGLILIGFLIDYLIV